jgi:mRNA-degrading endonuclease RelE of RelBE toxin-antitoxin system
MKRVIITRSVQVALRSLDEANHDRIQSWFNRLANWDEDHSVRNHAHRLDAFPGVHMMKTGSDLRIFFKVDQDTITILDIGKKQSILTSGQSAEGG